MTIDCTKVNIKKNSKNKNVGELQKYLKYLGYYEDEIDNQCGNKTVAGIKKLQKQYSLKEDGVFGPVTCKACGINGKDVSGSTLTLDIATWKNICNRYDKYVAENKKAPSKCYIDINNPYQYITEKKFKEILERYVAFVQENKREPQYVNINIVTATAKKKEDTSSPASSQKASVSKYVSSPHWTGSGCNKLGQCTSYFCGPHSIRQCLCKFGIDKYTEKTLAGYAGTTTAGTGHPGLNTAIQYVARLENKNFKVSWVNFSSLGNNINERFKALGELMSEKDIAVLTHILYRLKYGHYEVIRSIDTKNKTCEILNSLGTKKSDGSYYGYIETRSFNTEASYLAKTAGGQPAICIIEKK